MKLRHKKDNGLLYFEKGNQYGASYRCSECDELFVLPTNQQIKERPELLQSKEFSDLQIEERLTVKDYIYRS